jgi:hypothetical protein
MTTDVAPDSAMSWLKSPGEILDVLVQLLSQIGIDLPPLVLQGFFLLLVVALLIPAWKKLRARKKADRLPLVFFVAMSLLGVGVILGLIDNLTMPSRVAGTLSSDRLAELRVALLDFKGRTISTDAGMVDTTSGHFALHYDPVTNGRAQTLRITLPACKTQDLALSRPQLRAQTELQWSVQCIAG